MSNPSTVNPVTLARIRGAMDQLGYVLNAAARTMKTGHTNAIGLVVADIKNPFYPEIVDALTGYFYTMGKRVIVWNSDGHHDNDALEALAQGVIDGLVFTTIHEKSPELERAVSLGYPIVMVNRYVQGVHTDQVRSENIKGAGLVADYFLDNARASIGAIFGPGYASTAAERERGFVEGLKRRGSELDPNMIMRGSFGYESGRRAMQTLLDGGGHPDAVFCANDLMAFGALDGARESGVIVPEDLWVVGYDDVEMSRWESFGLTTVRQDSQEMARESARLLLQRIEDPNRPIEDIVFPADLIVRRSTGQTPPKPGGHDARTHSRGNPSRSNTRDGRPV